MSFYTGNFIHENVTSGPSFFIYETSFTKMSCEVSYMKFTNHFDQFACVKLPISNLTLFVIKSYRYLCTCVFPAWNVHVRIAKVMQVGHFENLGLLFPFIAIGHQARTQILLLWVETTLFSKYYYKKNGCVLVWCHSEQLQLSRGR